MCTLLKSLSAFTCILILAVGVADSQAQQATNKRRSQSGVTVKGSVVFPKQKSTAWNGDPLSLKVEQIEAKLREYVQLPRAPYPAGHQKWTPRQRVDWERQFAQTAAGKEVVRRNKALLAAANSFDIKIEPDGSFVIYDVPAGEYAIQGRYDKKINDTGYAYEIFGKLTIDNKVDLLDLAPITVEVTPQYQRGQVAPPLGVANYNGKTQLETKMFKGNYLMLNFWSAANPVAATEQQQIQATIDELSQEFKYTVLSINIDEDRRKTLALLHKNKLLKGSHGFTRGLKHAALANYGIRNVPSYWLIDPEGKILMHQYEFAKLTQVKPDFESIIRDRILNTDTPTLAPTSDKKSSSDKP